MELNEYCHEQINCLLNLRRNGENISERALIVIFNYNILNNNKKTHKIYEKK